MFGKQDTVCLTCNGFGEIKATPPLDASMWCPHNTPCPDCKTKPPQSLSEAFKQCLDAPPKQETYKETYGFINLGSEDSPIFIDVLDIEAFEPIPASLGAHNLKQTRVHTATKQYEVSIDIDEVMRRITEGKSQL